MTGKFEPTRRQVLMTAMTLTTAATTVGQAGAQQQSSVLVAYLTRTGNTRVIARQIARARGAELFEIVTVETYPEDYEEMVAQAQREKEAGFEPSLRESVTDMDRFNTVYLGFPIWGMTAPSPIRSFLATHDLTGKRLIPFITHGGYGTGDSLDVVRRLTDIGASMRWPKA